MYETKYQLPIIDERLIKSSKWNSGRNSGNRAGMIDIS